MRKYHCIAALATQLFFFYSFAGILTTRAIDVEGNLHKIGIVNNKANPVVLVFLDHECPISQRYTPKLNDLYAFAKKNQIQLYGIMSDRVISWQEAQEFSREYELKFPLLFDSEGNLAHLLKPTTVPEAYLITPDNQIIYRGRIDDEFFAVGKRKPVESQDLKNAIQNLIDDKLPINQYEKPIGCIFEGWKNKEKRKITYTRDIDPLMQANCVPCHYEGGIAPFSLETYKQTLRKSMMIQFATESRFMPIWNAESGYGHFRDQHELTEYQINLIKKWDTTGRSYGDSSELMPTPKRSKEDWKFGQPDQIFEMQESYTVPAGGDDIYRYFVIPNAFLENKNIRAVDFKPGATEVLHHSIFLLDYSKKARELDKKDPGPGFGVFNQDGFMAYEGVYAFGGWTPGVDPFVLTEDLAMHIPRGADVVMEIHYHPNGKEQTDKSAIGVYFSEKEPEKIVDGCIIGTKDIDIPAGDSAWKKKIWMNIPSEIELINITPHMHYIGKSVKAWALLPNSDTLPLIHIPNWDLRWQNIYTYREPVILPQGARIEAEFTFDNSENNFSNPSKPPIDVTWGWGTNDEMAEIFLTYVPQDPEQKALIKRASLASWIHNETDIQVKPNNLVSLYEKTAEHNVWDSVGYAYITAIYESPYLLEFLELFRDYPTIYSDEKRHKINMGVYQVLAGALSEGNTSTMYYAWLADKKFDQILKDDPMNWDAGYSKGYLHVESTIEKYVKKGVKMLEELVEKHESPNMPDRYYRMYETLAKGYKFMGEFEKEKATKQRGIKYFPNKTDLKTP